MVHNYDHILREKKIWRHIKQISLIKKIVSKNSYYFWYSTNLHGYDNNEIIQEVYIERLYNPWIEFFKNKWVDQ